MQNFLAAGEWEQPSESKPISAYVVEIEITKVCINRHFPLIVTKDKETHTNSNINDTVGYRMAVDNITLEDYVKYQGVDCNIIRGYKWIDIRDFSIRYEIQKLHEYRCKFKVEANPLQEIVKLIINSAYGNMIQKPIKDKMV